MQKRNAFWIFEMFKMSICKWYAQI